MLAERYLLLDALLFKIITTPEKRNSATGHTRGMCRQDYYTLLHKSICRTPRSHKNISYN